MKINTENKIIIFDDDIDYKRHKQLNEFIPNKLETRIFYKIDNKNKFIKDNLDDAVLKLNKIFWRKKYLY